MKHELQLNSLALYLVATFLVATSPHLGFSQNEEASENTVQLAALSDESTSLAESRPAGESDGIAELDVAVVEGAGEAPRIIAPAPLPQPQVVDVVVESATRVESTLDEVPTAIGVITSDDIATLAPLSFDDLTWKEPNVEFLGGPRYLGEQLIIRGEGGNAVTVRLDNARQNFVSGHAGQRFFVETDFLKEAEIIRGAGSFLYGSGSAGAVNLSTLDPTDIVREGNSLGVRMRNTFHSNTQEWAHSVVGAGVGDEVQFLVAGSDRFGRDINLADGVDLPFSGTRRESALGKFVWTPNSEHRFSVTLNDFSSTDRGGANPQPFAVGTTTNALVDRTVDFMQWSGDWEWNPINNDLIDLEATFYYNNTRQVRNYAAMVGNNVGRSNTHDLDVYGLDLANRSVIGIGGKEHQLVYGIDYYKEKQDGDETRADFFIPGSIGNSSNRPDAEASNLGLFLIDEIEWNDSLTFFAGVRYDSYDSSKTVGAASSQSNNSLTPQIGFDLDITEKLSIFGQYAKGFTAPTLNELYQDGSHFGVVPSDRLPFFQTIRPPATNVVTPPFGTLPQPGLINVNYIEERFVPNPNLMPETSDTFELGLNYEDDDFFGGKFNARVTGFYKRGENTVDTEIVATRTTGGFAGFANPADVPGVNIPLGPPVPPPPTFTPFSGLNFDGQLEQRFRQAVNRAETEIYGFEFTADFDADFWFASMTTGMLRGHDTQTGMDLNTITGDQITATLGIRPVESVELGVYGIWNGGRENLVSDPFLQTSEYDVYGAFLGLQLSENWQIRAGIDNAFDQAYERTSTALGEPGRNAFITSTLHF